MSLSQIRRCYVSLNMQYIGRYIIVVWSMTRRIPTTMMLLVWCIYGYS